VKPGLVPGFSFWGAFPGELATGSPSGHATKQIAKWSLREIGMHVFSKRRHFGRFRSIASDAAAASLEWRRT